jgi:hypothetical protein
VTYWPCMCITKQKSHGLGLVEKERLGTSITHLYDKIDTLRIAKSHILITIKQD